MLKIPSGNEIKHRAGWIKVDLLLVFTFIADYFARWAQTTDTRILFIKKCYHLTSHHYKFKQQLFVGHQYQANRWN